MTVKYLPKLLMLALLASAPVIAETTAGNDESSLSNDAQNLSTYGLDVLSNGMTGSDEATPGISPTSAATNSNDLWQRIKSGYAMTDQQSPSTAAQESWYASRPDYVNRMVGRSQKYLYHIVEEVEKRGMPTEIALLPMVESAFNPHAYSRSRASGIWQFIPSTGKHFGLKQNWWVDNRRDVMAATDAALTYLEKLHVMFGTWELALAAYNAGEGTVQRAIERNRKKGLPTDYESLQLPKETREYVPKLQAVKNIVTNPEQYGLDLQPIANQPYFTKVSTSKPIDTKLAAKLAGISFDEFSSLNPAYNRPVITSNRGSHELLLPVGNDEAFQSNLANYDKPLVSWQPYTTKRGERLDSISQKFGISVAQLRDVNDLSKRNRLAPGQQLLVPLQHGSTEVEIKLAAAAEQDRPITSEVNNEKTSDSKSSGSLRHTVRKGESVYTIAKRYGISTKDLLAVNRIQARQIKPGRILTIASRVQSVESRKIAKTGKSRSSTKLASSKAKTHYVVKRGETLSSIARKLNVAASDLQRWNNLDGKRIAPGHRLTIYRPDAA